MKKKLTLRINLEYGQFFITGNEMDHQPSSNELGGSNPNNLM